MTDIRIKSGIKPVHSFDLWGVLVVQEVLGPRVLEAYSQLMDGKEDPEVVARNMANYRGLLVGDKKALENKKLHVDTLEDPLWKAYTRGEVDVNFEGALYQDALKAMDDIANAGEGLCVLTTGNAPWVKKAIQSVNPTVGEVLRRVYSGNKAQAAAYEITAADLRSNGAQMVSHTEDQMKGFAGILQSTLKDQVELIYVERTNLATSDEVLSQGIDRFVTDLAEVPYTQLVRR